MEGLYGLDQLPARQENMHDSQIVELSVLVVLSRSDWSIRAVLFETGWSILPRRQLSRLQLEAEKWITSPLLDLGLFFFFLFFFLPASCWRCASSKAPKSSSGSPLSDGGAAGAVF
jgi:hypothetical protein